MEKCDCSCGICPNPVTDREAWRLCKECQIDWAFDNPAHNCWNKQQADRFATLFKVDKASGP